MFLVPWCILPSVLKELHVICVCVLCVCVLCVVCVIGEAVHPAITSMGNINGYHPGRTVGAHTFTCET